jgi:hypothetical protein
MWEYKEYDDLKKNLKKFLKRHRTETKNALNNLQSYLSALNKGLTVQQIIRGWIHSEPCGMKAIDQTGPNKPKKALRVYVYPDEETKILHIFTIGDKDSQQDDISHCTHTALAIKNKT